MDVSFDADDAIEVTFAPKQASQVGKTYTIKVTAEVDGSLAYPSGSKSFTFKRLVKVDCFKKMPVSKSLGSLSGLEVQAG